MTGCLSMPCSPRLVSPSALTFVSHSRRYRLNAARALLLLLLSLAAPATLRTQEVTGNLEGRVLSSNGEPLPAAIVQVKSSSLQGTRGTSTDENGRFRLLALPPGVYSVEVRRVSSRPVIMNDVRIRLGMTTATGDLRLESQSIVMSDIVVSGDRPLIDPTSPDVGATLVTEEFQFLPLQRNYLSIPTLLPQANESPFAEGANFSGATGLENQYRIDGSEVTDPAYGIRGLSIPYNFIKDIEIRSGAYAAEYRSTMGGIVNATTYSGGNEFTGQAFGFFTSHGMGANPFWSATSRNTRAYASYDVGFGVGGPIVLDRLWFYGAYNPSTFKQEVEIPGMGWSQEHQTSHGFAGKLTWKADDNVSIVGSVIGDPTTDRIVNLSPFYVSTVENVLNQEAVLQDGKTGTINASVSGTITFQNNFMVEGSVSYLRWRWSVQPPEESAKSTAQFNDQQTGTINGGIGWWLDQRITQTTADAKATWITGHHTVKAGLAYREKVLNDGYWANLLVKSGDTSYFTEVWASDGTTRNRIPSVFLQDTWEVSDKLTLNAGLRWDGQYIIGSDGRVHQKILGQYQPRVGFVLQLGEPGSERIYGSAGRFYEELGMNFASFYSDRMSGTLVEYNHDPRSDPSGGTTSFSLRTFPAEVPGLKGQFTDEYVLGYERRVFGQFKAGIRGIYRALGAAIEDASVENLGWLWGNPGEGDLSSMPKTTRQYTALVLTFEKPIGDGYSFSLAYVLSRNYGNFPGLYNPDNEQINPNASTIFDLPDMYPNSTGLLPNDVTHMLKLSGSYAFTFGLTAGAAFFLQSGTPINEFGGSTGGSAWNVFLQPRGTAGRMPMLWDLNLRLTYDVAQLIGWSFHPRLILDVLHVASQEKATVVDQVHYFTKDENGNQINPNPNYLKPTHYQQPMSVRLGMELDF